MNIKSFGKSISLLATLSLGFTGCGIDTSDTSDTNNRSSNVNSTTLTWNDVGDQFIIKTQMNNMIDYYHVAHKITKGNGDVVLNEGDNDTGTITTTCSKQSASGSYVEYSCASVYDTDSPLDALYSSSEKTIKLYDNTDYKVILDERSFTVSSETSTIGSLVQP